MRVWRLSTPLFPPLTGDGARIAGGRWNSPGMPMVYASGHLALAVLEMLVHFNPGELPEMLMAYEIEVPAAAVEMLDLSMLAPGWRATVERTRSIGDQWLRERRSLALGVPSVVVPSAPERNILLNPLHKAAQHLTIISSEAFTFDERLRR
jgi:RES domain-containing protein